MPVEEYARGSISSKKVFASATVANFGYGRSSIKMPSAGLESGVAPRTKPSIGHRTSRYVPY